MANPLGQMFPRSLKHVSWHGRQQPNSAAVQRRAERDDHAQIIVPSAATNMIECLDRDRDAFRHLASFLSLPQLGQLAGCSTRIRHWFTHDGLLTLLPVEEWVGIKDLESLAQCAWARRRIAQLVLDPANRLVVLPPLISLSKRLLRPTLGVALLSCLPWTAAKLWLHQTDRLWTAYLHRLVWSRNHRSMNSAMLHLPRLEHLRELAWFMSSKLDALALRTCFSAMSSSLQALVIDILPTPQAIEVRATVMSCIGNLRSLVSLEIRPDARSATLLARRLATPYFAAAQHVDFSGLPQLKSLTAFKFTAVEEMFFRASAEQCACLARCDALTSLDCGRWDAPAAFSLDELGQTFVIESEEAFLAERIGVLAATKGQTIFEDAAVGAMDQEPRQVRAHALTLLEMRLREHVTPLLWSHLSQFTALRELLPRSWADEISAAQLNKLSEFAQLQMLAIGNPALLLDRMWPPLLSCTSLTEVVICDVHLLADKLQSLLDSLPKLTRLRFIFASVPSLAPLHNSVLTALTLSSLIDEHGRPACARQLLAGIALPHLEHLTIKDDDDARLLPAHAAELNRPIFENCPLLRPSNFEQNLRGGSAGSGSRARS